MIEYVYRNSMTEVYSNGDYQWSFSENGPCEVHTRGLVQFSQINPRSYNRANGPAKIFQDGHIAFNTIRHGAEDQFHRTDGPAIIFADGRREYWVNGKMIPAYEFFLKYGVL